MQDLLQLVVNDYLKMRDVIILTEVLALSRSFSCVLCTLVYHRFTSLCTVNTRQKVPSFLETAIQTLHYIKFMKHSYLSGTLIILHYTMTDL